ncbi:MAG: sulfotransferase domain-containing protein, partial [Chthoniobacterales bacterium]
MAATDFCIAGFPKCGTTAVAQFFQQSPLFHVAEMSDRGHFEAPFFKGDGPIPEIPGVPGRINGHKCSSCAWSIKVLHRIHCANRACLFLFCVRDARSALVSWRAMHRAMALNEKTTWHFVHRTAETREFFSTCSLAEYFREYAADRLRHAESLERFHSALPHARFAIISQRKLATDAAGVMRALHH